MDNKIKKTNVLGVGVSAINIESAVNIVDSWISQSHKNFVTVTGVHGVIECQRSKYIRKIHNTAGMVTPDGMPLVWLSKLSGHPEVSRVYGPDLMLAICENSQKKKYRHFFYGGTSGTPQLLIDKLTEKFPDIIIAGYYSPPFRALTDEEDKQIVQLINDTHPDIIWIGLSTPKQEVWMFEHREPLTAPVLIGVGAAFDFHSGLKAQAPKWIRNTGFEWLFRLVTEPKRLWKRYLVNNPLFIWLVLLQALKIKRYTLD